LAQACVSTLSGAIVPEKLQRDILLRADAFVEHAEQTRIEGEIQQIAPDFPVTELWQVIAGDMSSRKTREQITMFDSVGFATEDSSALRFLDDLVDGTDYYDDIDLPTEPADPRNLFGLLNAKSAAAHAELKAQ
jgi:ornithine cyclodeaminase